MRPGLRELLETYDDRLPLDRASTIPAEWYTDPRIAHLEKAAVFGRAWQPFARTDQLTRRGDYVTGEIAGEPLLILHDGKRLRAFYNVCRHHAAAVVATECGNLNLLRCPYHGWTYTLDGSLQRAPEFEEVTGFDIQQNGLMPAAVSQWENFVLVHLDSKATAFEDGFVDLIKRVTPLNLSSLHFFERRIYDLRCNWKVFVDNYLDGGYHVPHIHRGLNSVLKYSDYTIDNGENYCLQSSPMRSSGEAQTAAVRIGDFAYYFWIYPNFMINWYEGVMDTNLVLPLTVDRCRVIFDFFFADVSEQNRERNRQSVEVSERIQLEDVGVCESVQRGLASRAYRAGRLSVRREAGEHLFHRLLARALTTETQRALS